MTPSNIYVMLQKVISKMADIHRKTYSTQTSLIGLKKQNIKAMAFTATARADRLKKKKEAAYAKQAAAAAAGASVSSLPRSPPDIDSVPSHRFSLSFDTIINTRNAILFLDSIGPVRNKNYQRKCNGFFISHTNTKNTITFERASILCRGMSLSEVVTRGAYWLAGD